MVSPNSVPTFPSLQTTPFLLVVAFRALHCGNTPTNQPQPHPPNTNHQTPPPTPPPPHKPHTPPPKTQNPQKPPPPPKKTPPPNQNVVEPQPPPRDSGGDWRIRLLVYFPVNAALLLLLKGLSYPYARGIVVFLPGERFLVSPVFDVGTRRVGSPFWKKKDRAFFNGTLLLPNW